MATLKGLLAASLAPLAIASCTPGHNFKNLVSFGDSLTDEARFDYQFKNGFQLPQPGTMLPERNETASGGYVWPRFVAQKTGATTLNYAIAGSGCSPSIVDRWIGDLAQFSTVLDVQIPTYLADLEGYEEKLYGTRTPENTVYTLWIGTNDMGLNGYLTDSNAEGTTLTSLVECHWDVLDQIYQTGGRRFVVFTIMPMQHAPLYNPVEEGGASWTSLWLNKTDYNVTQYAHKIEEYSTSVNTMLEYGVPFQFHGGLSRWPGATISVFDTHALMMDVMASPAKYLESPTELKEYYAHCQDASQQNCTFEEGPVDRYFWFDELHPSERIEELVADEFIQLLAGGSKYGKTYQF